MKKFLVAMFAFVTFATLSVSAEETTPTKTKADENREKYEWFVNYEKTEGENVYQNGGYNVWYTYTSAGALVGVDNYGYSGVDVIFGDADSEVKHVFPIARGNVLLPKDGKFPGQGWGSLSVVYKNDTEAGIPVTQLVEPAYMLVVVDANGKVLGIDNAYHTMNLPEDFEAEEGKYYDVYWDAEKGEQVLVGGAQLAHKPLVVEQLKFGDLGTDYLWLTKEDVNKNKVADLTFADTDLLYKNADGKYTNAAKTGDVDNTPVNNDEKGFIVPAGGFVVAFEYIDNINFNTPERPWIRELSALVNGQDGMVKLEEHDVTAPTFTAKTADDKTFTLSGIKQIKEGVTFELPTVTANDLGKILDSEDQTTPTVTEKIYKYDRARKSYDSLYPEEGVEETTEYVVESGMWGSKIATKFNTTLAKLEELNPGINWNNLQVGQKMIVPNPDYFEPIITEVDEIDTSLTGDRFKVVYTAEDADGNKATASFEVHVISAFAPIIKGFENKSISLGETVDLTAGVTVEDGYGYPITENLQVISTVNNNVVGTYTVLYVATNAYNLTTVESITVSVLDSEAPVIFPVQDITLVEGQAFDPTKVVLATDNYDSADALSKYVVEWDYFSATAAEAGEYEVTVGVDDVAGNSSNVTFTITVIAEEETDAAKIEDLQSQLDDANDANDALKGQLDTEVSELEGKLAELEAALADSDKELGKSDTTNLVIAIVAAVVGVTGVALPFVLKRK